MMFCTYPNIFVGQESFFGAEPVLCLLCRFLEHLATSTATAGVRQVTKTSHSRGQTGDKNNQQLQQNKHNRYTELAKRIDNRQVG